MTSAQALLFGLLFATLLRNRLNLTFIRKWQTRLLQTSIVGLGASIHLNQLFIQGLTGVWITLTSLCVLLFLGVFISKKLGLSRSLSWLLASGTAICGGSAIATIAPVLQADEDEISVALGIVFLLNSVGLLVFPPLGHWLEMTQSQFGLFAALAIHDTSSVIGAASAYGSEALQIATTTKLVRALWIIPLVLGMTYFFKPEQSSKKTIFPKFIGFFILMSAVVSLFSYFQISTEIFDGITRVAKQLLIASIFLIGLSIQPKTIKSIGPRAFIAGVSLWLLSIGVSYVLVQHQAT